MAVWGRPALCFLFVLTAGGAQATCDRLISTLELAEKSFGSGNRPDQQSLDELGLLISGLNNDAVLAVLGLTSQSNSFS